MTVGCGTPTLAPVVGRFPARWEQGNRRGATIAKVSKETASNVGEFGPVTDRREEMDGYTVEFVSFAADSNLDGPLQALPGGMCQCPHWGYVITGRMRFLFGYVDAGTGLLQFSPAEKLAETEWAFEE